MAAHRVKIVIIDQDAGFLEEAAAEFSAHFTVYTSSTGEDGLKLCAQVRPQVVIADSGMSDIAFADFLNDLKGLDASALRIATSRDYSAIENVMQAIDTSHIHKYFRKPIDFSDLVETINARTVNYQVGRGLPGGGDSSPAYKKLHTIVNKAKDTEKLGRTLEAQVAKLREVEADSFGKVRTALEEVTAFRKKVADKDATIGLLQAQSLELEQLKKRDVDRVEQERETLKHQLKSAKETCETLLRENRQVGALKSDNEQLNSQVETLRADIGALRVSVTLERETMLGDMAQERKAFLGELQVRKDEAESIIEVHRARNKVQLQALQDAFEVEKQHAAKEIQHLRADLEKDRAARLVEIEAGRKRLAEELAAIDVERKRVEEELVRKKEAAERVVEVQRERNKAELQALQGAFEDEKRSAEQEIDRLKAELNADREKKLAKIEASRALVAVELAEAEARGKRAEQELAQKKVDAERAIELQRERNKAELETLHAAFKQEHERAAWYQIEQLKAEIEKDRNAKLAEIEVDRKRGEQDLEIIKAGMAKERERLEQNLKEERAKAEEEIQRVKDAATNERKKLTEALEADLEAKKRAVEADLEQLRASATRELDRFKVTAQKKERELADAVTQANRLTEETQDQIALAARRAKTLESEVEAAVHAKDLVAQELESVRADYDVIVRSREALRAEVMELRESLR